MAFTVRPTDEETKVIESAGKLLDQNAMSKTVIMACAKMLQLNDRVKELESQLSKQRNRADSAERVIKGMQQASNAVMNYKAKN